MTWKLSGLQIQLRRPGGIKRLRTTVLQHLHLVFPENEIIQSNRNSFILQILGLLVWALIATTEYFHFSPFGWVMFVTVFYWLLTLFLFIINLANGKIRHMPWTTVVGALLYSYSWFFSTKLARIICDCMCVIVPHFDLEKNSLNLVNYHSNDFHKQHGSMVLKEHIVVLIVSNNCSSVSALGSHF